MISREAFEKREYEILAPRACKASESKGRRQEEAPCDVRTCFQRDRDRIIHSKAFRRLMHKTQVFLAPEGDHYRTRLTHTLEVSQIARTIARGLALNEDLTEAIALGHDLGHTPFGHTGERVLQEIHPGGFRHNEQSLRVVDYLEDNRGKQGMNLTMEVRDGILNHTGSGAPFTLEGQIVKTADRIAYINHDIDDALRSKVITFSMLPKEAVAYLGSSHGERIDTLVKDMVRQSDGKDAIHMSEEAIAAMNTLRTYLFKNVYFSENVKKAADLKTVENIIASLYTYYCDHPDEIPDDLQAMVGPFSQREMVKDYVAGMTDRYAVKLYESLFMPKDLG